MVRDIKGVEIKMEDQISLNIANAIITLMDGMKDGTVDLYEKVNLGRIKRLTAHNGIVSEVYINDETDFQYNFSKNEHAMRKIEVLIEIFTKGIGTVPTEKNLNAKDATLKVIEENPTLGGLTGDCRILKVANGRKPEGDSNKPTLFSASMIHVQYDAYN